LIGTLFSKKDIDKMTLLSQASGGQKARFIVLNRNAGMGFSYMLA
jgi:hypothetical protein